MGKLDASGQATHAINQSRGGRVANFLEEISAVEKNVDV